MKLDQNHELRPSGFYLILFHPKLAKAEYFHAEHHVKTNETRFCNIYGLLIKEDGL